MKGEQLLIFGIALVILATVCAAVAFIVLCLRWSRLKRDLERDYGPKAN